MGDFAQEAFSEADCSALYDRIWAMTLNIENFGVKARQRVCEECVRACCEATEKAVRSAKEGA